MERTEEVTDVTEMDKLDKLLTASGIEHTYDRNFQGGTRIAVFEHGRPVLDAICTPYSYGGRYGLLEVMLENLPLEILFKVQGWLSADQVMKMASPYLNIRKN